MGELCATLTTLLLRRPFVYFFPLHKVLVSPLADNPVRADLDFEVPACYKHNPPRLQPGYLAKFKEETLFYIFYSMPQVSTVQLVLDAADRDSKIRGR